MSTLTQAHNELFRRSPDECFSSVESLIQHCRNEHRESQACWHLPARLQPTVGGGDLSFSAGEDGEHVVERQPAEQHHRQQDQHDEHRHAPLSSFHGAASPITRLRNGTTTIAVR